MFTHCFGITGDLWLQSLAAAPCGRRDDLALGWRGSFPLAAMQMLTDCEGRWGGRQGANRNQRPRAGEVLCRFRAGASCP